MDSTPLVIIIFIIGGSQGEPVTCNNSKVLVSLDLGAWNNMLKLFQENNTASNVNINYISNKSDVTEKETDYKSIQKQLEDTLIISDEDNSEQRMANKIAERDHKSSDESKIYQRTTTGRTKNKQYYSEQTSREQMTMNKRTENEQDFHTTGKKGDRTIIEGKNYSRDYSDGNNEEEKTTNERLKIKQDNSVEDVIEHIKTTLKQKNKIDSFDSNVIQHKNISQRTDSRQYRPDRDYIEYKTTEITRSYIKAENNNYVLNNKSDSTQLKNNSEQHNNDLVMVAEDYVYDEDDRDDKKTDYVESIVHNVGVDSHMITSEPIINKEVKEYEELLVFDEKNLEEVRNNQFAVKGYKETIIDDKILNDKNSFYNSSTIQIPKIKNDIDDDETSDGFVAIYNGSGLIMSEPDAKAEELNTVSGIENETEPPQMVFLKLKERNPESELQLLDENEESEPRNERYYFVTTHNPKPEPTTRISSYEDEVRMILGEMGINEADLTNFQEETETETSKYKRSKNSNKTPDLGTLITPKITKKVNKPNSKEPTSKNCRGVRKSILLPNFFDGR